MPVDELKFKTKGEILKLSLKDECLLFEYKTRFSSGKEPYLFENLSPEIGYREKFDTDKIILLQYLLLTFLASIIVFFSDYSEKIPLLAPALFLISVIPFVFNINNFKKKRRVILYDDMGESVLGVPIPLNESTGELENRKEFFSNLSLKIKKKQ